MSAIDQIYKWLGESRNDLVKEYQSRGHEASGNWGKSLNTEAKERSGGYVATIYGEAYTGIMETGRMPNKRQDTESLRAWVGFAGSTFLKKWVEQKQIQLNPYAIAWKIAREGVKVPNPYNKGDLVASVITRERINELLQNLTAYMIAEIRSDVAKTLNTKQNGSN